MSSVDEAVEWDGVALIGCVVLNGIPTRVKATREIIHSHAAGFNDAVTWEIDRYRVEIFEKLKPFLLQVNSGG